MTLKEVARYFLKEKKLEKPGKLISGSVWPYLGCRTVPKENYSVSAPSTNTWDAPKIYLEKYQVLNYEDLKICTLHIFLVYFLLLTPSNWLIKDVH